MEFFLKFDAHPTPKALRCADIRGAFVIAGSLEKKVFLFSLTPDGLVLLQHFDCFDSAIYSIRFVDDQSFVVGQQNGQIFWMTLDGDIVKVFEDQKQNACSLDVHEGILAAGHWGGLCVVWDLNASKVIKSLPNHQHGVTVRFLGNGDLVTGSQNGVLNLWTAKTFDAKASVAGAHTDIIREIQADDTNTYTCSNDSSIAVWSWSLQKVASYKPHTSFVYSLAVQKTSDGRVIYSGGEDMRLRMTVNGAEVFSIGYPSTIWKILVDPRSSDIITAGEDGVLRVFTHKKEAINSLEAHEKFVQASDLATLKNPEVTEQDLAKFPSIDKMATSVGKKEGEIKVFVNQGRGEAYMWQGGKWVLMGEMVGQNPSMGLRVYEGDKYFPKGNYDFIFDIQDDTGQPRLLPFNRDDNPLVATEKFLAREGLSGGFKEQIMQFVIRNSKPTGQPPAPKTNHPPAKPMGELLGEQAVQAPQQSGKSLTRFPIIDYVYFETFNKVACLAKIKELNAVYEKDPELAHKALTKFEMAHIEKLVEKIGNPATEYETTIEEAEEKVVDRKLLKLVEENALPILDLIRMYPLHHDSTRLLNAVDCGAKFVVYAVTFAKFDREPFVLLILRFFCNLFKNNPRSLLKCDTLFKDFLGVKAASFTPKCTALVCTLLTNMISALIENHLNYDFLYLLEFLDQRDLSWANSTKHEAVNFVLAIGNALSSQREDVRQLVARGNIGQTLRGLTQDTDGLAADIVRYLEG
jgi:phospholipase A-2-activating protein